MSLFRVHNKYFDNSITPEANVQLIIHPGLIFMYLPFFSKCDSTCHYIKTKKWEWALQLCVDIFGKWNHTESLFPWLKTEDICKCFFLMKARTSSKANLGLPTNKSSTFKGYMRYLSKASYLTLVEMSKILQCFCFGLCKEEKCTLHKW